MQQIVGVVGACRSALVDLIGLPARHLTAAMDDFDELWLSDTFLDLPEGADPAR
jgi:hypothetical protein